MTLLLPRDQWLTPAEYLAFEDDPGRSEPRYEYEDGRLVPMIGVSYNHNRINLDLAGLATAQLDRTQFDVFCIDVRVEIDDGAAYYYPDLVIARRSSPGSARHITRPILVAEILSPSTEERDRGTKLRTYGRIESLRHILLVRQDRIEVTGYDRLDRSQSWTTQRYGAGDTVRLSALPLAIAIDPLYRYVDFDTHDA